MRITAVFVYVIGGFVERCRCCISWRNREYESSTICCAKCKMGNQFRRKQRGIKDICVKLVKKNGKGRENICCSFFNFSLHFQNDVLLSLLQSKVYLVFSVQCKSTFLLINFKIRLCFYHTCPGPKLLLVVCQTKPELVLCQKK